MKLLLTSSGITNTSIHNALADLLGKPISESTALFIPTGVYPYPGGPMYGLMPITGKMQSRLCGLGWKSLGILELTALPSIHKEVWLQTVEQTDALLVWGGDPLYISYWMQQSGLGELLPSLLEKMVYVGVSAGSMATSATFGETYSNPRGGSGEPLSSENIILTTPGGELNMIFVTAHGIGLVDFAIIPHLDHKDHQEASMDNAKKWAARLPMPVYAIDDQTAIKVVGNKIEVVSEGEWKLFTS
ncbi:MAG: Type 1 glutamine amidotransferase-like domain-containing protein [Sphingobacteriales bacterium]